ncbi:MAG: VOC family protein [Pseudomonadales bacterium]
MADLRIGYVNVHVGDLQRSLAFFRDALGLPVGFSDAEFGYASFATAGTGFAIAQTGEPDLVGRHTGIGFVVSDLDAAHAELAARGVHFTQAPTRQPWGGYMALFTDPDGNVFYLDQVDQATD